MLDCQLQKKPEIVHSNNKVQVESVEIVEIMIVGQIDLQQEISNPSAKDFALKVKRVD